MAFEETWEHESEFVDDFVSVDSSPEAREWAARFKAEKRAAKRADPQSKDIEAWWGSGLVDHTTKK